jgi:carbamoyl-phosphate synthase large subunit
MVIEMNPRVSRSSALASKATGFPIAKIAAKLAIGYTLDEIPNDITRETLACFEPTIDYVVTKIPRFAFEKFPQAKDILTTQMKSVGEAMAIGRTFKESLQKAIRSLELGSFGFEQRVRREEGTKGLARVRDGIRIPNAQRLWFLADALRLGMAIEEIFEMSGIDPWFLRNIQQILEFEERYQARNGDVDSLLPDAKRMGFSDARLAFLSHETEDRIREKRKKFGD